MEETLVFIKPDGVKRGLVGQVLARFEARGFEVKALKMAHLTDEQCDYHYHEHVSKPFYPNLKNYIKSGPVVLMVLRAEGVIDMVRQMLGATDASKAAPGTIRGDFARSTSENIVHASDSAKSAAREIDHFFKA